MRLPSASAAQAVISETTRPAPKLAAMRRNGASVTPDIGAKTTGFGSAIGPMKMSCIGAALVCGNVTAVLADAIDWIAIMDRDQP